MARPRHINTYSITNNLPVTTTNTTNATTSIDIDANFNETSTKFSRLKKIPSKNINSFQNSNINNNTNNNNNNNKRPVSAHQLYNEKSNMKALSKLQKRLLQTNIVRIIYIDNQY